MMARMIDDIDREAVLLVRSGTALGAFVILLAFSVVGVGLGIAEVRRQEATIVAFQQQDAADRAAVFAGAPDWGGAAYAGFHATWHPPSELAFAAFGQRDVAPWMMRVRALALEGQIHEAGDPHPELALAGRFDFAFVVAFLLPLFAVLLLYDLVAAERESGRLPLLAVTAGDTRRVWIARIATRLLLLLLAVLVPLWIGGLHVGATSAALWSASGVVVTSLLVWTALIATVAFRPWPSVGIVGALAVLWLVVALVIPLAGKLLIDAMVPRVEGAEVALLQREAVNDAWDLPKAATLEPFYASHPEWAHSTPVTEPFHWKWYFAFQQRGDELAAERSAAYRASIVARDDAAGWVAWISPPVAVLRALQRLACTDLRAGIAYDAAVRSYHGRIRHFYYAYLFEDQPFDPAVLLALPEFDPAAIGNARAGARPGAGLQQE